MTKVNLETESDKKSKMSTHTMYTMCSSRAPLINECDQTYTHVFLMFLMFLKKQHFCKKLKINDEKVYPNLKKLGLVGCMSNAYA